MKLPANALLFSIPVLVVVVMAAVVDWAEARVQANFVAGVFLAIGYIVTFVFRELSAKRARDQRSRDLQSAIKAEIYDYTEALEDTLNEEEIEALKARIVDSGDSDEKRYHPLIPRVSPPVVFDALAEEISLLPEKTIDDVVQFYSVLSDLTVTAEDLMKPEFRTGPADSRSALIGDYLEMRVTTQKLAKTAVQKLSDSLEETSPENGKLDIGLLFGTKRYGA